MPSQKMAKLSIPDHPKDIDIPIISGSAGYDVLDITKLNKQGVFTYDPGFTSTASCQSKITFIDGAKGVLLHRGYPIEDLAESSDFLEVCYLLLFGELPSAEEKQEFVHTITNHTMVHEQLTNFFNGFPRNAHPMAIMCGVVGALSAFYHDSTDIDNARHRKIAAFRLIAKMPTLAAMSYKYSIGQPFIYPCNELHYSANFLHMMFNTPCETHKINPTLAKAMDLIFMLHADHEQNASTSTVRLSGSTGANPFACIASGIAALWGPSHGGANEATLRMLTEIGDKSKVGSYIKRARDPNDSFRLMGFGHRVYKEYDPRAKIMRAACKDVLDELDLANDSIFKVALHLEKIALEDEYFIDKKLYPNVDFYSGIILKALNIPVNMFTVIFAVGRTPGWIAHWNEMISGKYQINRPRQLYTGATKRKVIPVEER